MAAFSGTPTSGQASLSVAFTDESTGSPTSWAWDFGDDTTSTDQNPTHVYDTPGTYTVELTATNDDGDDTETKVDYIEVLGPPVAEFSRTPSSGADTINRVAPALIDHGKYVRPTLDIVIDDDLNDLLSARLGVEGVFVLKVNPRGPASAAGLRGARIERGGNVVPGDVIVSINDKPVPSVAKLQARLDDFNPGDKIRLGVLREGKRISLEVTLMAGR